MDDNWRNEKKQEFDDLLRTYPHINNYELSCTMVPCCTVDKREDAKKVFQRYCSVFFLIDKVHCYKNWRVPTCIWQVDYVHSEGNLPGDGPALQTKVETLMHKHPENCAPIGHLEEKEKVAVFYSVFCDCVPKVFEDMTTKSPLLSLDEIGQSIQGLHLDGE